MQRFRVYLLESSIKRDLGMFGFLTKLKPMEGFSVKNLPRGFYLGRLKTTDDGGMVVDTRGGYDMRIVGTSDRFIIPKRDVEKYNLEDGPTFTQKENLTKYFYENPKQLLKLSSTEFIDHYEGYDHGSPQIKINNTFNLFLAARIKKSNLPTPWIQWLLRFLKGCIILAYLKALFEDTIIWDEESKKLDDTFSYNFKILLKEFSKCREFFPKLGISTDKGIYDTIKSYVEAYENLSDDDKEYSSKYRDWLNYLDRLIGRNAPDLDLFVSFEQYHDTVEDELIHFYSIPYLKIQNYVPTGTLKEVRGDLSRLEKEWRDSIQGGSFQPSPETETIIDFGDGLVWQNLNAESCSTEGESMGHCGNTAAPQQGDLVLSLRTKQNKAGTIVKPHLTFILHADGTLGEMKGRANTKPKEKYHPYIYGLLTHKTFNGGYLIKGITGGGYAAQSNFELEDLSEEMYKALYKERPDLFENM